MLYDVHMTTRYAYGRPVVGGRHLLRLVPGDIAGQQRVIAASLEIAPRPQDRSDGSDFFGNRTTAVMVAGPHDEIAFTLRARVDRNMPVPGRDLSPPVAALGAELALLRSLAPDAPHHFLAPSPRVGRSAAVSDWAAARLRPGLSVLAAVERINLALHETMRYDAGATDVDTPLEDSFRARHGVCQDFSHIMIAALRDLGIPAGYVSGFLRTEPPPGRPRLEGADAMHAWVMAWCGTAIGWVEFDPTNALRVGNDHVTVARGRDYADVSPVKGVLWTAGSQTTHQAVDLIPVAG